MTDDLASADAGEDELLPDEISHEADTPDPETEEVETPEGEADGQPEEQPETDEPEQDSDDVGKVDAKREAQKAKREEQKARRKQLRDEGIAAVERLKAIEEAGKAEAEPKIDDFEEYADYAASKALWKQNNGRIEQEKQQASSEIDRIRQQREQIRQEAFIAATEEARSVYTDFDAVVTNPNVPISQQLFEMIQDSDQPADLAYHVAKDHNLAYRLSSISDPIEQAREVGRIEASLSRPAPKRRTSAPPPTTPVRGRKSESSDPNDMQMADYRKWREKQG